MPLPAQLDIYKASAGSGKTFLLTIQYLRLVFENPKNYKHILAVTFTNKATAEMKMRILGELKKLATTDEEHDNKERNIYADRLLETMPNKNLTWLRQQAKHIYSNIIHDYGNFSVSTIDSFVQRIIKSFAYEIGLDAGFKLQLNTELVKDDLADRLYKLLDNDKNLLNWVSNMALGKLEEGKSWNFRKEMIKLAGEIFKEEFAVFDAWLKNTEDTDLVFKQMQKKLIVTVKEFETTWEDLCASGRKILQENGLESTDFNHVGSSFANIFFKQADDIAKVGLSKRAIEVISDPEKMISKKSGAEVKNRIMQAQSSIIACLQRMIYFFNDKIENYRTAISINRNFSIFRLLEIFCQELSNYRSQNNALLISDTNLLLRQLTKETEASFIFEKTGNYYHHFLIDEFQDTSGFQWDNFKPLLENNLSQGNYCLLVGDVKQAIYRWRSGDWRLLMDGVQKQLTAFPIKNYNLEDNRRSAVNIIEFNNFLFSTAPAFLQQKISNLIAEMPEELQAPLLKSNFDTVLQKAYENSIQQIPDASPLGGMVEIQFVEAAEADIEPDEDADIGDDIKSIILTRLHQQIIELLQQGCQPVDIAIFTRTNAEAAVVIEFLMQAQIQSEIKYNLISAEALLLEKNNTVSLLIAALEWLLNRHKLALATLRQRYARNAGFFVADYEIFIRNFEEDKVLPAEFKLAVGELNQLPVPELVSTLIHIFKLNNNAADTAYLLALQDAVASWSKYGEEGLINFIKYWNKEGLRLSLPSAANTNAIEVMTIHKSKGLAFTVVLLPFLNWNILPDGKKTMQLWVNTQNTIFPDVPIVPVRYGKTLGQTAFAYNYLQEIVLSIMDNINMLYVAFTRARRQIKAWAILPKKKTNNNTMGELLHAIVNSQSLVSSPVLNVFDSVDNIWRYGIKNEWSRKVKVNSSAYMPLLTQTNWRKKIALRYTPLQTKQIKDELPRQHGILLHEALHRIQHPGGLKQAMDKMVQQGVMTQTQLLNLHSTLAGILAQPIFSDWRNGRMKRLSEREIIADNGSIKRPDLVLYNSIETRVIDFKFTENKNELPMYKQQVNSYAQLIRQIGFVNISSHLIYATGSEHVVVEEIDNCI